MSWTSDIHTELPIQVFDNIFPITVPQMFHQTAKKYSNHISVSWRIENNYIENILPSTSLRRLSDCKKDLDGKLVVNNLPFEWSENRRIGQNHPYYPAQRTHCVRPARCERASAPRTAYGPGCQSVTM